MALNVNRWLKYAKARIDSAVGSGHEELDRLEAEREAERADKPWLASDSTAPTFDEARARIAWEADQQAKKADRLRHSDGDGDSGSSDGDGDGDGSDEAATGAKDTGSEPADAPDAPHRRRTDIDPTDARGPAAAAGRVDPGTVEAGAGTPGTGAAEAGPEPRSPQQIAEDAERETARLELEDRQRKSAERLEQIRQELGIADTPAP